MLITFTSRTHPDVVMFGDIAGILLHAMGQREEPPGILRGDEIRLASEKLKTWLAARLEEDETAKVDQDDETGKEEERQGTSISLKRRALPLLDMLEKSYADESDVIWR